MKTPGAADSRVSPTSGNQPRHKAGRWLRWLLGLAALGALILACRHFSDARDFVLLAKQAEPWWLVLAVAFQAGTYLAQAQVYRSVVHAGKSPLPLKPAYQMSLIKLFVDQALPSAGLSGTAVFAQGLERLGIPRRIVATAVAVAIATGNAVDLLCLVVAMVIAAARGEISSLLLVLSLTFALFVLVLIGLIYGGHSHALPRWLARIGPLRRVHEFVQAADTALARNPGLLARAALWELCLVLLDAATVWVLIRALGTHASPSGVFASFVLSALVNAMAFMLPGGLGAFEGASVVTLRFAGVPVAVALSATLLFRGLSFWLPMLPGFWFSRRFMKSPKDQATEAIQRGHS